MPEFATIRTSAMPKLPANARMIHVFWRNGEHGVSSGTAKYYEMSVPEYARRYKTRVGDRGWPDGMNALDMALSLYVNFGPRISREFCARYLGGPSGPTSLI